MLPLFIPPLRERREDIVPLALDIMQHFNNELQEEFRGLHAGCRGVATAVSWPGNIRELRNVIERTMILCKGDEIDEENLPEEVRDYHEELAHRGDIVVRGLPDGRSVCQLAELEDRYIHEVLNATEQIKPTPPASSASIPPRCCVDLKKPVGLTVASYLPPLLPHSQSIAMGPQPLQINENAMAAHTIGNSKSRLENNPLCRCTLEMATSMSMRMAKATNRVGESSSADATTKLRRSREVAHPPRRFRCATEKPLYFIRLADKVCSHVAAFPSLRRGRSPLEPPNLHPSPGQVTAVTAPAAILRERHSRRVLHGAVSLAEQPPAGGAPWCASRPVPPAVPVIADSDLFSCELFWLKCQPSRPNGAFWSGITVGFVLLILVTVFSRTRIKAAEREALRSKEIADHREYERNVAQQELLRRLEEERELAKEKMQFESQLSEYEKYASLAQLALGAAHEINNPLLGILSHLELEWKDASGERREEIEQCIEGAKRISLAVRGLLDYARPGPLMLSKVNLSRLAAETLKFLEHQPMFRQIALQNCIPLDLPSISADANQLSQILMNLLLNSAQATPPGGTITVLADKVKFAEMIELRVRDTGTGIPADILPHVFEPFFTTKRGKGTGLGLSITQSYVRSHGGDIQVESIPNLGTTVRVTLPIRQVGKTVQVNEEVIV